MDTQESDSQKETKSYDLPKVLPPPLPTGSSTPVYAIILGLVGALVLGAVFFAVTRLIYIYIMFNAFLGIGIGIAVGFGVRKGRYTNEVGLAVLSILVTVASYAVFNYALFEWVLRDFNGVRPSFYEFLQVRAKNDTLFAGIKPGTVGNIVVWVIEAAITGFFVFKASLGAAQRVVIEAVPKPVIEFVLHLASEDRGIDEIEYELNRRGWSRSEDRQRAMAAVAEVISKIQEEQSES